MSWRCYVTTITDFLGILHLPDYAWLLTDDPACERCLKEDESTTHILCDCEAIAYLRFRHLGQFFMEPSDFYDAPIFKVLHFIRSVGLIRASGRGSTIDRWRSRCGGQFYGPPLTYIHTCMTLDPIYVAFKFFSYLPQKLYIVFGFYTHILWHVDPLLGNARNTRAKQ
jgi:hypothetical protein